jgi:glycosyltransferase involved in cell wall biosynthesis
MKVLFDHSSPFRFAHGGFQVQIERTKDALESLGADVDWFRWWEPRQEGDLIHFWSVAGNGYLQAAQRAGIPVVMTTPFSATCNRPVARLRLQGAVIQSILKFPFARTVIGQLSWPAFNLCTHNVVGLEIERQVLEIVYAVPPSRISTVPLGLSDTYLTAGPGSRTESHLICVGTIVEWKNSVELAEYAKAAKVPILFVGKPYRESDPYWSKFKSLIDNRLVKYHSHIESEVEMVNLLQKARGFVLFSSYENWCLAAHEAAACGLPLLLPDQKWSRERFGNEASYLAPLPGDSTNVQRLQSFYEQAPRLQVPKIKLFSWREVAGELIHLYEKILKGCGKSPSAALR